MFLNFWEIWNLQSENFTVMFSVFDNLHNETNQLLCCAERASVFENLGLQIFELLTLYHRF